MPIIKTPSHTKEAWRIRLDKAVCDEITAYCHWANIKYKDRFINEACKYVFQNDKEWISHKKSLSKK